MLDAIERPRICLTGGWFSSDNIGDHAILSGHLDLLKSKFEDPDVWVITADPAKVRARYGLDAFAARRNPLSLLRKLASSDALIFTGGTPFYDRPAHMTYYAAVAVWASIWRVPIVIYGVSLRTVRKRYTRWLLRRILRRARIVGAREDRSLRGFFALMGRHATTVRLVPDVAFSMVPSEPEVVRSVLGSAGLEWEQPFVALSLRDFTADPDFQSHHYSRGLSAEALDRYRNIAAELVEHIVTEHGISVLMCPMHTRPPDDDRRMMESVLAALTVATASKVYVIKDQLGPKEMKAVLGRAHVCVGVRFHSLVLSMAMNVPALSLAYAPKNSAIMSLMGLERYSLDLAELSSQDALGRINELMLERDAVSERLAASNRRLSEEALAAQHMLTTVISHRGRVRRGQKAS